MRPMLVVALTLALGGCADFLSAMSAANEGMGAQCTYFNASTAGYDNGEYVQDVFFYNSQEEKVREKNWLERRMDYYLSMYRAGIYYETSPVTGVEYKFNVYCSGYQ